MLLCDTHWIPETVSVFCPFSSNVFLHDWSPEWSETLWSLDCESWDKYLQPHLNSSGNLVKWLECATTLRVQWAGVWGKTPFSTGESSQFCRIHYIPKSVELRKQLVWAAQDIAKPQAAWKYSVKIPNALTFMKFWSAWRREVVLFSVWFKTNVTSLWAINIW